jgi:hypothetical protein
MVSRIAIKTSRDALDPSFLRIPAIPHMEL